MTKTAALLNSLISELESSLSSRESKPRILLPTPAQFYRLGLVLADLIDTSPTEPQPLHQSYRDFLEAVPLSHLRGVLEDLQDAFRSTLELFEAEENTHDVELALQCLYGLYSTSPATLLAAAAGHPVAGWSLAKFQLLSSVYNKMVHDDEQANNRNNSNNQHPDRTKSDAIISNKPSICHLLSLVAIFLGEPTVDYEELLPAINQLQEKPNKYTPSTWESLVHWQRSKDPAWKETLVSRFTEPTQQEYILAMFALDDDEDESQKQAPARSSRPSARNSQTTKPATTTTTNPASEIQRRVEQVRAILPYFGQGFIEVALSHFQGDVERTTNALVESQFDPTSLPAALQLLDKQLPARWKGATTKQQQQEEAEAKRITQEKVRAMDEQQEAEARALEYMGIAADFDDLQLASKKTTTRDEYNDDYDDQYDDMDGFMTADHGLYDDYDTVRTYNQLVKQVGEEQTFWSENRNMNRSQKVNKGNKKKASIEDEEGDDEENGGGGGKTYRGPDKIKGGRLPKLIPGEPSSTPQSAGIMRGGGGGRGRGGRGRGGRGGRGGQSSDNQQQQNGEGPNSTSQGRGRGSARHKNNKLASRRDKQKQAAAKRTG